MRTKLVKIDGVTLITPDLWHPEYNKLDDFPNCCGAGDGLGEKVIPDVILGLRISAACAIHDFEFATGGASWSDFHAINFRFVRNIYAIIQGKSKWGLGLVRTAVASVYFYAVDTKGALVYERLRLKEGKVMTA